LFLIFVGGANEGAVGNNNKSKTAKRGKYMFIITADLQLLPYQGLSG
jgi:hypothetical protein